VVGLGESSRRLMGCKLANRRMKRCGFVLGIYLTVDRQSVADGTHDIAKSNYTLEMDSIWFK
jgi:hypothetical protein